MSIPHRVDNSILDDTRPVIYRKGKIMYHLDLPYREMCDLDYYSICSEIQKKRNIRKVAKRHRGNIEETV